MFIGTNTLGIGLAIHLRDKFTTRARSVEAEFRRLHGSAQKVMSENLRASRRIGLGMMAASGATILGMRKALRTAADFEHVMKSVELITSANRKQMMQLDKVATQLGTNTIFSPQEIAGGMETLAKAGFKVTDILGGAIQAATHLGAALDKPITGKGGTAELMAQVMQGFGLGSKSAPFVADMLAKTSLASAGDLEDLAEGLKHVSATAVDLGIGLPETLAMLAKLSNSGLKGGMGGRSLNNMLVQLSNSLGQFASPKHQKVLAALGLSRGDLVDSRTGALVKPLVLVQRLDAALRKLPPIERISALNALLNLRGARALGPLLRNTGVGGSMSEILDQINKSSGTSSDMAIKRMNTLWGTFERMKDTIWNFWRTIGTVLKPVVKPVLDFLIKVVAKITEWAQTPIGKALVITAAGLGLVLGVMGTFLVTFTSIKLMSMAATVSFANMGRVLALSWNQGTAAALRYVTTANGAMMVNTKGGPRWRNMTTGRFMSGASVASAGGSQAGIFGRATTAIRGFMTGLSTAGGMLGVLGKVLKAVTGPIGWFIGILGYVAGFKNIIKLVVFGLATLLNAIIFAAQAIIAIALHPIDTLRGQNSDLSKAGARYRQSQENFKQMFGMRTMGKSSMQETMGNGANTRQSVQGMDQWIKDHPIKTQVNLKLDGKTVGEVTFEEKRKKLSTELGSLLN